MGVERLIEARAERKEPDLVVRQTVSRESRGNLGVLHEARCKHCGEEYGPDTLDSILRIGGAHLRKQHGILIDQWVDVNLGQERWDGLKHDQKETK